jgi:hypothetical protein
MKRRQICNSFLTMDYIIFNGPLRYRTEINRKHLVLFKMYGVVVHNLSAVD